MKYFNTLPLITQTDYNGNYITVNNLLTRSYILPSLQKNIYLFYDYVIKEIDSPENIAYKYYNDVNRYWLLMYANNIIDPQAQWPLTSNQFIVYLNDKYTEAANGVSNVLPYTTSTVYAYYQTVTTYDSTSTDGQSVTIQVDETTYNSIIPSTKTVTSNDITYTKIVDKKVVSIYDHEIEENERKRSISLIKDVYASDVESQFQKLMSV